MIFFQNLKQLRELLISKILISKISLKISKNILHVKGSEGILDFKGTKLIWAEASALQGLLYTYK